MNSLKVPEGGLMLHGPSGKSSSLPPQAFAVPLSDKVLEGILKSSRNGESVQLALGTTPTLHYGTNSYRIAPPADPHPYDIYLTQPFESSRSAERVPNTGSLFRKPRVLVPAKKARPTTTVAGSKAKPPSSTKPVKSSSSSGLDSDIEALQNGLAAHDAARDRARVVEKVPTAKKGSTKIKGKLFAGHGSNPRSLSTSPALKAIGSPSMAPALSATQQAMERAKEQRVTLVHELAVKSQTMEHLRDTWQGKTENLKHTLEKMADYSSDTDKWTMKKTYWKELDVWNYDYDTEEMRQTAIDNAIRQFDKQRLSSSEPEWQKLLPREDRGQGICLSRLQANLARGPAPPAPRIKVQKADGGSTPMEKGDSQDGTKTNRGGDSMSRSTSNPLPSRPTQNKKLLSTSKSKAANQKPSPTKGKGTKSNGGRILSQEFIENSDSSGDEAVTAKAKSTPTKTQDTVVVKSKPTAREPVKALPAKRPLEDDDSSSSSGTPLSKRLKTRPPVGSSALKPRPDDRKAHNTGASAAATAAPRHKNTSPSKSSPLASSPPTNASDLEEDARPIARKRKAEGDARPLASKRQATKKVSPDVVMQAHKFKSYYSKYQALHYEVISLENPPDQKVAHLQHMRDKLAGMKRKIYEQHASDRD